MVPYLILGLGAYFVLIVWRTKVEAGKVTMTAFERFAIAFRDLEVAFGEALRPTVERAARAMADLAAAFSRK